LDNPTTSKPTLIADPMFFIFFHRAFLKPILADPQLAHWQAAQSPPRKPKLAKEPILPPSNTSC